MYSTTVTISNEAADDLLFWGGDPRTSRCTPKRGDSELGMKIKELERTPLNGIRPDHNLSANFCCRSPADAANGPRRLNQKLQGGGRLFGREGRLAALDLQTGRLLLARPHLGIDAAAGKELAMVAALDDAAGFND